MLGKAPASSIRVRQGFLFGGFLLAHGRMTTGTSALFLLDRCVRTEGLLTKGDPRHTVDYHSSLFGDFLVDELHDTRIVCRGRHVTGPRSAGFGLDLVQPHDPFFTGRYSYSYHAWVVLKSNYRTWLATLSTVPTRVHKFSSLISKEELRLLAFPGLQKPLEAFINPVKLVICSFCEKNY